MGEKVLYMGDAKMQNIAADLKELRRVMRKGERERRQKGMPCS